MFITVFVIFAVIFVLFILYKILRPQFPVKVNCWFCATDTVVPYGNRNCWDCPFCQQYNGFQKDGDYNKPIPTQYDGDLNHPVMCTQTDFISNDNILCEKCSRNQLLKTKQLAAFVPMNEAKFDTEVEEFERYLEKLYKLCGDCQAAVNKELYKQDEILQQKLESVYYEKSDRLISNDTTVQVSKQPVSVPYVTGKVLEAISFFCAFVLTLAYLTAENRNGFFTATTKLIQDITIMLGLYGPLHTVQHYRNWIAVLGLASCIIAKITLGKNRLYIPDALHIPVWLTVLLIQNEFLEHQLPQILRAFSLICNLVISAVCMMLKKRCRSKSTRNIRRLSLDNSQASSSQSETSRVSPLYSASQVGEVDDQQSDSSEEKDHLDDTLSELGSFSLGEPGLRRTNSGLFNSSFTSSSQAHSSISGFSVSNSLKDRRPLISPAKLRFPANRSSTPAKFPISASRRQFSVNRGPCLQAKSENLFLPHSTSAFPTSTASGSSVLYSTFTTERPSNYNRHESRIRHFHPSYKSDNVEKDSDSSRSSEQTSVCAVDSTTNQDPFTIGHFLKHPGFIGFVMGASIVGNLVLVYQVLQSN